MKQDRNLFELDWEYRSKSATRPDYKKFFEALDDAGVTCAADMRAAHNQQSDRHYLLRSLMSNTVQEAVAWLNRSSTPDSSSPHQVRLIADAPDSELLFMASLLTEDAVILSDSSVHLWSTELPNHIHAIYWEGLLDQLLLCREPLTRGNMVVCPAIVRRTVGRGEDIEGAYTLDFSSSLSYPDKTFLRSGGSNVSGLLPENLTHAEKPKPTKPPISVPFLRLDLPVVRGIPVAKLRQLLEEETDALRRLRFVMREVHSCTGEKLLDRNGMQNVADLLEYEIAQVQLEYERMFRKREHLLATAGLGILGMVLSVTLPPALMPMAVALGASAAGVNSLKYAFAIRDSDFEIRSKDYYLAWNAWRHGMQSCNETAQQDGAGQRR